MAENGLADGLRKVFMAGVGAVAAVGERGGQVVETLAERGESVVKQGRDLNRELLQKGTDAVGDVREDVLRATLAVLSPASRSKFVEAAQRIAAELDAADAARAAQDSKGRGVTVPVQDGTGPLEEPEPQTAPDVPDAAWDPAVPDVR